MRRIVASNASTIYTQSNMIQHAFSIAPGTWCIIKPIQLHSNLHKANLYRSPNHWALVPLQTVYRLTPSRAHNRAVIPWRCLTYRSKNFQTRPSTGYRPGSVLVHPPTRPCGPIILRTKRIYPASGPPSRYRFVKARNAISMHLAATGDRHSSAPDLVHTFSDQ